jgi:hypothetical protein
MTGPSFYLFIVFEIGSCYAAQAGQILLDILLSAGITDVYQHTQKKARTLDPDLSGNTNDLADLATSKFCSFFSGNLSFPAGPCDIWPLCFCPWRSLSHHLLWEAFDFFLHSCLFGLSTLVAATLLPPVPVSTTMGAPQSKTQGRTPQKE